MKKILSAVAVLAFAISAMAATPALTSPVNGSTLAGSTVTFAWSAGTNATQYQLWVGSTQGNLNLGLCSGLSLTCTLKGLPTNGSKVYVKLAWQASGVWQPTVYYYTFTAASSTPPPPADTLTAITCGTASSGAVSCTVTLASAAPTGGFIVALSSNSSAITVPSSVTVTAGATTADFQGIVNPVTLTAKAGTVTKTATVNLAPAVTAYSVTVNWKAPATWTDPSPLAGYAVLRSNNGGAFSQLNATPLNALTYLDTAITNGSTYEYAVESVDDDGDKSVPTPPVSISIP